MGILNETGAMQPNTVHTSPTHLILRRQPVDPSSAAPAKRRCKLRRLEQPAGRGPLGRNNAALRPASRSHHGRLCEFPAPAAIEPDCPTTRSDADWNSIARPSQNRKLPSDRSRAAPCRRESNKKPQMRPPGHLFNTTETTPDQYLHRPCDDSTY